MVILYSKLMTDLASQTVYNTTRYNYWYWLTFLYTLFICICRRANLLSFAVDKIPFSRLYGLVWINICSKYHNSRFVIQSTVPFIG